MSPYRERLESFGIGVSLANLCYIRLWAEIFGISGHDAYFLKIGPREFIAAVAAVLAFGTLLGAGVHVARVVPRLRPVAISIGALLAFLVVSNLGKTKYPGLLYFHLLWRKDELLRLGLLAAALLVFLVLLVAFRRAVIRVVPRALLYLSAFVPLTIGRALFYAVTLQASGHSVEGAAAKPGTAPSRAEEGPAVVLIVFDAMGRRLAFEDRPAGIELPAFDRLRRESVDATRVTAVAPATARVLPALLSGVLPRDVTPLGTNELELTLDDGRRVRWSEEDSLFAEARRLGGRASAAGWYHPYCRVFRNLDECAWYSSTTGHGRIGDDSLLASVAAESRVLDPYTVHRRRQIATWRQLLADSRAIVTQPGRGFALLHLNVPHVPAVWDGESSRPTPWLFHPRRYADSLEHADLTLAEIRRAMEDAGTWDATTVIVTSDHPAKEAREAFGLPDEHVPLLIKLAGAHEGRVQIEPVSAGVTHELIRWLLSAPDADPESVARWLDQRAENRAIR